MSRTARILVLSLLLSCLPGAILAERALPSPRQTWIELRTPTFTLYSSAGERKTREIALSFERLHETLRRLKPEAEHASPIPTRIFVFDDDRSYRPYKAGLAGDTSNVVGHFAHQRLGNFIAINAHPKRGEALPIVYHEYLHAFLNVNFPRVPLWFNEGLAEFYSTFRVGKKSIDVGRPVENHVEWLRQSSFIPLENLFAIDESSQHYREAERRGLFYSQSWLLVHYLLSGGPERARDTADFLADLGDGIPARTAFDDAFGLDYSQLEKELRAYVNAGTFSYYVISADQLQPLPSILLRELPRAEVLYQLGSFLALFDRMDAARSHLRAALELEPDSGDILSSLAYVEQVSGNLDGAGQLFGQAATATSREPLSLVLQAGLMLDRCSQQSLCDALPSARERLRSALELDPDFAEASALLGNTYLLEGSDRAAKGIAPFGEALARLPRREDIAFNLAMLYLQTGQLEEAASVVARMELVSKDIELVRQAREQLERSELTARVNEALHEGDPEKASTVVREALALTDDTALREDLEGFLKQIEDALRSQDEFARYDKALAMAQAGRIGAAVAELEKLLAEASDPMVRTATQDLLDQIEKALGTSDP